MRISPKILKRVGVLALLICAFAVVERENGARAMPVVAAFQDCPEYCQSSRNGCESDVQAMFQSCQQMANLGLSSCQYQAGQNQSTCNYYCIVDWYYSGGTQDVWSCYDSCEDAYNTEIESCATQYNSELGSCSSEQSNGMQNCSDAYQQCMQGCQ